MGAVSRRMEAVLILAEHPVVRPILMPVIDVARDRIDFEQINYGALSGGEKAAITWAWCIWADQVVPGLQDPLEGFGVMSDELQIRALRALMHRWA